MRSLPYFALLGLAALLAAAIAWELRAIGTGDEAPRRPVAANITPALPTAQTSSPNGVAELANTSLARPLFSPDRRPPPASGTAVAAAPDTSLPRLTGILVTPNRRSATFVADPKPLVVLEGDRVGNFTVRAIEPGQVTLAGPDGQRSIHPRFGASRPPAPAGAQPQAASPLPPPAPSAPTGGAEPLSASFPTMPEPPKDAMPFEQNPTPSGWDILRHAGNQPAGNQAGGNQPPGNQPPGSQPPGSQPLGNQPPGNQPPGGQAPAR